MRHTVRVMSTVQGKKIDFIKEIRTLLQMSLVEAKNFVEADGNQEIDINFDVSLLKEAAVKFGYVLVIEPNHIDKIVEQMHSALVIAIENKDYKLADRITKCVLDLKN